MAIWQFGNIYGVSIRNATSVKKTLHRSTSLPLESATLFTSSSMNQMKAMKAIQSISTTTKMWRSKRTREDEVVEPLRHEGDGDLTVAHGWAHPVEELRLAHVVTVHDHDNVALGDVLGLLHAGVQFVHDDMVEIGGLAVELAGKALAVADVVHIVVPYTLTCCLTVPC
jgi:hypothetical protein